ncbi:MAG: 2-isopropylmalate synthase [Halanaerobiaceae bacterium]
MKEIMVLDTTLRDGEQVPGAQLNLEEKVKIARQLQRLGVDVIEAGFPISSPGDFEAVKTIAREVGTAEGPMITGLARAVKEDIDRVYQSVKYAEKPLIHIVLGTSDVHINNKFKKDRAAILKKGVEAVEYASGLLPEVQYSTEDASRTDFEYLWETVQAVVEAGATMVNIPDTVGYAVPEKFGNLIGRLHKRVQDLNHDVVLSVHCHNDTGLAVANTLAAVKNGANKVECTVNGIGERAGNAALEEVVMGLKVRPEYYNADTGIETGEIKETSRLVSKLTGLEVQVNKAITGDNAFAHSSGIHQDGILKSRDNYEIITPQDVGTREMELILTARSGRHAVREALQKIGYENLPEEQFETFFEKYLELADEIKEIYFIDLYRLAKEYLESKEEIVKEKIAEGITQLELYEPTALQVIINEQFPTAVVEVKKGETKIMGSAASSNGRGPIDVLFSAVEEIISLDVVLKEYKVTSLGTGKEAQGRVRLELEYEGKSYLARARDENIIKASFRAYLNGVNKIILAEKTEINR